MPCLERPLALSSIPYGFKAAASSDGLWRLGDQAAVIPSFSGDGMSIALHSGHLAASMYLEGRSPRLFTERLNKELRRPVATATTLSRLLVHVPAAARLVRLWPGLLTRIALSTRVPEGALSALKGDVPLHP